MIGTLLFGYYNQIVLGEPWGDNPIGDSALILTNLITILILLGIFLLFHFMKLQVEIDAGFIRYRFFPFVNSLRSISAEEVKKIYVRQYKPIWEYGGWGYRVRPGSGKAMNVKGNWGLQIEFSNGKKLLLGTQKPNELETALNELKVNWRMD